MRSNAVDHIFQAISWHAEDVLVDSETADGSEEMHYMIKCFGRKPDGRTISASISNFAPYFYIKVQDSWNGRHIKALHEAIVSHLPSDMANSVLSIRLTEKKDFWGFSNFRLFKFARLRFQNLKTMKWVQKMLSSPFQIRMLSNVFNFQMYESNIDPFIRFMHHQNIEPTGWIKLPAGKYRAYTETLPTICDEDVEIKWKDVEKAPPQTSSAPFLVASVDIECVNNFGEFPVPRKDFRKMASQLYDVFQKIPSSFSLYDKVKRLGQCIYYALDIPASSQGTEIEKGDNFDVASHMTKIEFKRPIKKEKVRQYFEKYLDNLIMDTLMGAKNKKLVGLKNRDYKTYEKTKDGVIVNDMTNLLNSARIGEIKGDEIIQIGTTFHKYGERACCKKVIICLRDTNPLEDTEVIVCNTEEDVLIAWRDLMMRENPDIITGYNIFGFDFVYLHQRAQDLGIASMFMQLSRFKDVTCAFCEKQLSSSALGDNILRYIDMHGRVLIDLMKVVQRDHKLDEYKLDTVAKHFLGMQKDDVSPQDIVRFYHGNADDRSVIAKYCIKDCELCNQLMIKLEIVTNNMGMSNVCLVPLSYIFMRGQGIKIFSLVMKQCSDDNYCIPVVKKGMDQPGQNTREGDDVLANVEDQESYEGAIVLDPKEGIYIEDPVSVMDYSSLYPSSMISENLSHDCMVIDRQYDNLPGVEYLDIEYDVYAGKGDKKIKAGITSSRFVQLPNGEKGIVPRILVKLLDARKSTRKMIEFQTVTLKNGLQFTGLYDESTGSMKTQDKSTVQISAQDIEKIDNTYNDFQKAVLDGLQLAYKVTANSLYGQMGAKTSPLYLKDIAACTTATGRNMILKAKAFLEEKYGANIIYGDTDSVFATFPNKDEHGNKLTGHAAIKKSIETAIEASKQFRPLIKQPHDLEYEKSFWPFILLSKKRYVGNLYEMDDQKFKQKSMGIVLKRRDNAHIVKTVYGGIIDIILNKQDIPGSVRFLNENLQKLIHGNYPMEELVITKSLRANYKNPDSIAHKVLAERIGERDPGNKPQVNDRIPFVYIDMTNASNGNGKGKGGTKKVLQGERIEHPDYIRKKKLVPDYGFYITNQIMNPVTQVYGIVPHQIPHNSKSKHYYEMLYAKIRSEETAKATANGAHIDERKVKERYATECEKDVQKLLFDPYLEKIVHQRIHKSNHTILEYFKPKK